MKTVLFLLLCFILAFFISVGIELYSDYQLMHSDISDFQQNRHVFEAWVTYFEQNPGFLSYRVTEDGITGGKQSRADTILLNVQGIKNDPLLLALFSELDFKSVTSETTNVYFRRDYGEIVHIGKLDSMEHPRYSRMYRLTELGDGWYYGQFWSYSDRTFFFILILSFLPMLFKGQKFTRHNLSLGLVLACFWLPAMWSVYRRRLPDLSTLLGYVEIVAFLAILVFAFKPLFKKTEAPLS